MGVRYLIVVEADRPVARDQVPVPAALPDAFGEQLDLVEVEVDSGLRVFRNTAWFPVVASVESLDALAAPDGYVRAASRADLDGAPAPLAATDAHRYEGTLPDGADLWFSAASADGWDLTVGGRSASRTPGFGWGTGFAVEGGGEATLEYSTPLSRLLVSGAQAAAWVVAVWALVRTRRRRVSSPEAAG
jgi:hypothetical protein